MAQHTGAAPAVVYNMPTVDAAAMLQLMQLPTAVAAAIPLVGPTAATSLLLGGQQGWSTGFEARGGASVPFASVPLGAATANPAAAAAAASFSLGAPTLGAAPALLSSLAGTAALPGAPVNFALPLDTANPTHLGAPLGAPDANAVAASSLASLFGGLWPHQPTAPWTPPAPLALPLPAPQQVPVAGPGAHVAAAAPAAGGRSSARAQAAAPAVSTNGDAPVDGAWHKRRNSCDGAMSLLADAAAAAACSPRATRSAPAATVAIAAASNGNGGLLPSRNGGQLPFRKRFRSAPPTASADPNAVADTAHASCTAGGHADADAQPPPNKQQRPGAVRLTSPAPVQRRAPLPPPVVPRADAGGAAPLSAVHTQLDALHRWYMTTTCACMDKAQQLLNMAQCQPPASGTAPAAAASTSASAGAAAAISKAFEIMRMSQGLQQQLQRRDMTAAARAAPSGTGAGCLDSDNSTAVAAALMAAMFGGAGGVGAGGGGTMSAASALLAPLNAMLSAPPAAGPPALAPPLAGPAFAAALLSSSSATTMPGLLTGLTPAPALAAAAGL